MYCIDACGSIPSHFPPLFPPISPQFPTIFPFSPFFFTTAGSWLIRLRLTPTPATCTTATAITARLSPQYLVQFQYIPFPHSYRQHFFWMLAVVCSTGSANFLCCYYEQPTGADPGQDPTSKVPPPPSADPKMVVQNNGFCGLWRFCFRHTAGGIFFVRPYVCTLKILRILWRIQKWLKSAKKDFDPEPTSGLNLG